MYRHILFDMDGTMIDSEPYYVSCLRSVGEQVRGRPVGLSEARRVFSMNSRDALAALGIRPDQLRETMEAYDKLCFLPGKVPVIPGVLELLRRLREEGKRLAIYSARFTYEFSSDPAAIPLLPFFDEVIGVGERRSKPDPDGALEYMERHKLSRQEVLYVGDSEVDSLTAQAAGVDLALVEWKSWKNERRFPARYYCRCPDELLAICLGEQDKAPENARENR